MKMNRRSVLGAIGLVGVGTGAAFGSGAFTSTTAERAVEVNVFGNVTDDAGVGAVAGDTAQNEQEGIADAITNNSIDVLVDLSFDSIGVRLQDGGATLDELVTDGSELFPNPQEDENTVYTGDAPGFPNDEGNYVSLVANDVTIVFGPEGFPPNSTVGFDDVFAFADPNSNSGPLEATFETNNPDDEPLLTDIGEFGNPSDTGGATVTADIGNGQTENADVSTGTANQETEDLDIRIEPGDD